MKTEWDYTVLADAYVKRLDFSKPAIDVYLRSPNTLKIEIPYSTNIWISQLR